MTFHKTIRGETWDILAKRYYGSEKLMHVIIQANPNYSHYEVLPSGIDLVIPDIEVHENFEELPPWKR